MTVKLNDEYDDPVQAKLAADCWTGALNHEFYETDGEYLFMLICRGIRMYTEAWANDPDKSAIGHLFTDLDDLDDPDRIDDPGAEYKSLAVTTLQAILENVYDDWDRANGITPGSVVLSVTERLHSDEPEEPEEPVQPEGMPDITKRFFLAWCVECEATIPFDNEAAREEWLLGHTLSTSHTVRTFDEPEAQ